MHDEQGSGNAGDARGPIYRKVSWVDHQLDTGKIGGSARDAPGGQLRRPGYVSRRAVWAPFDERTHVHTRAGSCSQEPSLFLVPPLDYAQQPVN